MLFNSYIFVFVFLPITVAGYYAIRRAGHTNTALVWLLACSYFFYGWWNTQYVLLLALTTLFNFFVGRYAGILWHRKAAAAYRIIAVGIAANLAVLIYFKYTGFLARTIHDLFDSALALPAIVLPLGISFFTFQKIAYLADVAKDGTAEKRLLHYSLFVSFFPQLIAGPIVHPKDILPQFDRLAERRVSMKMLAMGITFFAIGLFKKTVFADSLSPVVGEVFDSADQQMSLPMADVWAAAIAYTLQIYFDFSGYSDMAIGLALLFGIRLPVNFNSPYQASNIIDFWRRWHMTLSRFLRDYLYIPLGGNRRGRFRRYLNLVLTMFLGGLWHGANWTFAIWGLLHGGFLIVNHLWRMRRPAHVTQSNMQRAAGQAITFFVVVVAWIFFRAPSVNAAIIMLKAMFVYQPSVGVAPTVFRLDGPYPLFLVALLLIIWAFPNTQVIMNYRPGQSIDDGAASARAAPIWQPNSWWAAATIALFAIGVWCISDASEFIYFQF
jgi:D-alanyl-lipoteichoic acid acyltransferase DltB (MBOAT superfamily)